MSTPVIEIKENFTYHLTHKLGSTFVGRLVKGDFPYLEGDYTFNGKTDRLNQLPVHCANGTEPGWTITKVVDDYEHERKIIAKRYPWMNEDQAECYFMLCDLYGGDHHVYGKVKDGGVGGITVCTGNGRFSTFDFDLLTKAVLMAHNRMIRFEICPANGTLLRLHFSKRHVREGRMHKRHPTIQEAIQNIRA